MKLTITMQVAVDGVIQGNGGLHYVDRKRGFERGGWAMPLFDEAAMASMNEIYERAGAFLFGHRTFEVFAESWGKIQRCALNPSASH